MTVVLIGGVGASKKSCFTCTEFTDLAKDLYFALGLSNRKL